MSQRALQTSPPPPDEDSSSLPDGAPRLDADGFRRVRSDALVQPRRTLPTWAQYGFAFASVAGAVAVRYALAPYLGREAPLLIFVLPTVVTALLCGMLPALLATLLSTVLGGFLFIEPVGRLWPSRDSDQVRVTLFVVQNLAIIGLIFKLQRTRVELATAADTVTESVGLIRAVVDTTPHAIIASDLDGTITAWNAAATQMFGWSPSEVIGRPLPHIPDDQRAEFEKMRRRALGGERLTNVPAKRRRKDGTVIPCEISLAALLENGRPIGVLATLVDTTEQRNLQEQLRQAQKMEAVGQLAAGVAHDFNNQLTAIMGHSQLAADVLPEGHEARQDLAEIERAAATAASLTRQLLAFSRRQILQMQPLDVNAVIASSLKLLNRTVQENVVIQTRPASEPSWVVADAAQLEHVLLNLVVNARDAMPNGGTIVIETHVVNLNEAFSGTHFGVPPGQYVLLSVTDTGGGMTKEVQTRIFEPFFTTKPSGQGTGLGLAMVYGTVRQMGGTIWVYSEPGRGSTFKLYFPRVTPTGEAVPRIAKPQVARGNETILVVDDDAGVRRLVVRTLQRAGHRVLEAATADDAIALAGKEQVPPQLLITDVIMPGMNGPDLAQRLTDDIGVPHVLYTSGYADQPLLADQLARGEPFLSKPFTPDQLVTRVRDILDGKAGR